MRLVLMLLAILILCGCVWTRLLDMKNQFKEFDRYFIADDANGGLVLKFMEPCIQPDDIGYLLGGEPTSKTTTPDKVTTWTYHLKRGRTDSIGLVLHLTSRDVLADTLRIPAEVLKFIPRERLLAMIRAFGKAEIDRDKRQATAGLAGADAKPISPGRATVIAALGEPDISTNLGGGIERLSYIFKLLGNDNKLGMETTVLLDLKQERLVQFRLQAPRFSTWVKLDGSD